MDLLQQIVARAKADKQRIVLPEAEEERTLKAADKVLADDQGNFYMELVNIYNTDLAALDYTMPKNSFSITFTIEGMDSVLAA